MRTLEEASTHWASESLKSSYLWCGGQLGTAVLGGKCSCAVCGFLPKHSIYCTYEGVGAEGGCLQHQIKGTLLSKSNSQGLQLAFSCWESFPWEAVVGFQQQESTGSLRGYTAVSSHFWSPSAPIGSQALIPQGNLLTLSSTDTILQDVGFLPSGFVPNTRHRHL